jgi:hypothetical protein
MQIAYFHNTEFWFFPYKRHTRTVSDGPKFLAGPHLIRQPRKLLFFKQIISMDQSKPFIPWMGQTDNETVSIVSIVSMVLLFLLAF